jgi:hypothetical protein
MYVQSMYMKCITNLILDVAHMPGQSKAINEQSTVFTFMTHKRYRMLIIPIKFASIRFGPILKLGHNVNHCACDNSIKLQVRLFSGYKEHYEYEYDGLFMS